MPSPMTLQEAFDKVWEHFVVEGKPPAMHDWECRYRMSDGRRCAIGVLIPDERYEEGFEGESPLSSRLRPLLGELLPGVPPSVLESLQMCHDGADENNFTTSVRKKLATFAMNHDLTVPEPAHA